jgi:tetratricopeptide (TPR) repeat protein
VEEPREEQLRELEGRLRQQPTDLSMVTAYLRAATPRHHRRAYATLARCRGGRLDAVALSYGLVVLARLAGNPELAEWRAVDLLLRNPEHAPTLDLFPEAADRVRLAARVRDHVTVDDKIAALGERHLTENVEGFVDELLPLILAHPENSSGTRLFLMICKARRNPDAAIHMFRALQERGLLPRAPAVGLHVASALVDLERKHDALAVLADSFAFMPYIDGALPLVLSIARDLDLRGPTREMLQKARERDRSLHGVVETMLCRIETINPSVGKQVRGVPAARLLEQARELELLGRHGDAVQKYRQYAELLNSRDGYLEAALATERMGSLGSAEFLYNHVKKFSKGDPQAEEGLARVKRARRPPSAEEAADYRKLAQMSAEAGDFRTALSHYMRWAELVGTADALAEVALICERQGQTAPALHLFQQALNLNPQHATALEGLPRVQAPAQRSPEALLQNIQRRLELSAPEGALTIARDLIARTDDPDVLVALARLLRGSDQRDDPSLGLPQSATGALWIRWFYGLASLDDLRQAGLDVARARRLAARLALAEGRVQDVGELAEPNSLETVLALHTAGDTPAALALLGSPEDVCREILGSVELPDVTRIAGLTSNSLRDAEERAYISYEAGELEEAAFRYALVGQSREGNAWLAKLNEVIVRLRRDELLTAEGILLEQRAQRRHEPNLLWTFAICALRLDRLHDANNALRELLAVRPKHGAAHRVAAALTFVLDGAAGCIERLTAVPSLSGDPQALALLLCVARSTGDRRALDHGLEQLHKLAELSLPVQEPEPEPAVRRESRLADLRPSKQRSYKELVELCARLMEEEQGELAEQFLTAYLRHSPYFVPARILRELVRARRGKAGEAVAALLAMTRQPDKSQHTAVLLKVLAECYLLDNKAAEAALVLELDVIPHRVFDEEARGLLREAHRQLAAEQAGSGSARADSPAPAPQHPVLPNFVDIGKIRNIVVSLRDSGRTDEIVEMLRNYLKRHRMYIPARHLLADELIRLGRTVEAEQELRQAFELSGASHKALALETLIRFLVDHGGVQRAAEVILEAVALPAPQLTSLQALVVQVAESDQTGLGHLAHARWLHATNRHEECKQALEQALFRLPDDARVLADVRRWAPLLLDVPPDVVRRKWERLCRQGGKIQGLELVRSYRRRNLEAPGFIRLEVDALCALGHESEAVALLEPLLERQGLREDHLSLAGILARLGREDEELAEYRKLLTRNPFDVDVHRRLRATDRAQQLLCVVDDEALLQLCHNVIERGRDSDHRKLNDALLARFASNRDEALRIVRQLVQVQPAVPTWRALLDRSTARRAQNSGADELEVSVAPSPAAEELRDYIQRSRYRLQAWGRQRSADNPPLSIEPFCPQAHSWAGVDPSTRKELTTLAERVVEVAETREGIEQAALFIEAAWLYRFARPRRHRAEMLRGFEERFMSRALELLGVLPPDIGLVYGQELGEVGSEGLPLYMKQARQCLQSVQALAGLLSRIDGTTDVTERLTLIGDAYNYCDRLTVGPRNHLEPALRQSFDGLGARWRAVVNEHSSEARRAARLEITLRDASQIGPDAFLVDLALQNVGSMTARALTVRVERTDLYRLSVDSPDARLDIPPNSSCTIRLRVTDVPAGRRAVELKGSVRYCATDTLLDEHSFEDVIRPPWIIPATDIENRYKPGPPVEPGDASFITRGGLLNKIRQALGVGRSQNVIVLYGLRRVGKTSLLKNLLEVHAESDLPVLIDLQRLAMPDYKTGDVLHELAKQIAAVLNGIGRGPLIQPLEGWRAEPSHSLETFLQGVRESVGRYRIVVMLDEFEELLGKITKGHVYPEILGLLRSLMQHESYLSFIIVGGNRVIEMARKYSTALFNLVTTFQVSFLSADEGRELIRHPVREYITYDASAVEMLLRETAGHPYFLQRLCQELVLKVWPGRDHITDTDVRKIIAAQTDHPHQVAGETFSHMLDSNGLSPEQRLVLAAIAWMTEQRRGEYCSAEALLGRLRDLGCELTANELWRHVVYLSEIDLARYERQPDDSYQYRISIPLFARWLYRHNTLESLADKLLGEEAPEPEDLSRDEVDDDT